MKFLKKYFRKHKERRFLENASTPEVFRMIYETNKWGDPESVSGKGSNMKQTESVRRELPGLLAEIGARSMLDVPCGDFHWLRNCPLDLDSYIGADIVDELVRQNAERYGNDQRHFMRLDLTRDTLPAVDVILCRDCLVHLCFEDAARAVDRIIESGSRYLLATTFVGLDRNVDKLTGKHRPLNMELAPFGWPPPITAITESTEGSSYESLGKSLALWRVADLKPVAL